MKVDATICVVKINGTELPVGAAEGTAVVRSVWNHEDDQVEIILGKHWYTLRIAELRAALDACQCAHEFYISRR